MSLKDINCERSFMERIDLAYICEYPVFFNHIYSIDKSWSKDRILQILNFTEKSLKTIVNHSIYSPYLTICLKSSELFFDALDAFYQKINGMSPQDLDFLQYTAREFETVLKSVLANLPVYIITPKGGFDVDVLTLEPHKAFHSLLLTLIPEAKYDVEQAAKCLAFDVTTGAAFHLHRINEMVVRRYWEAVTKEPVLEKSSVGIYLSNMQSGPMKDKDWDGDIVSTLSQINRLHRNPTLHPEKKVTSREAIGLFGIINSIVDAMIEAILKKQNPIGRS